MNKYEALGYYTELNETLTKLKDERSFLVSELSRAAQRLERNLINEKGVHQKPFNPEQELSYIATNSGKITELQVKIKELIEQINYYAQFCDKPQI